MQTNDLQDLALRLAAFTDILEQRADTAVAASEQSAQNARAATDELAAQSRQLSQILVAALRNETKSAIQQGTSAAFESPLQALAKVQREITQASAVLDAQSKKLTSTQGKMISAASLALIVGSLLAAGGSSYLVWKNQRALKQAEFSQALIDATRSGAITLCDGKVCARTGTKPKRHGDRYILAE